MSLAHDTEAFRRSLCDRKQAVADPFASSKVPPITRLRMAGWVPLLPPRTSIVRGSRSTTIWSQVMGRHQRRQADYSSVFYGRQLGVSITGNRSGVVQVSLGRQSRRFEELIHFANNQPFYVREFAKALRQHHNAACRYLLSDPETRETIAALAAEYGFEDPSSFGRAFRREFGRSARDVRASAQADTGGRTS